MGSWLKLGIVLAAAAALLRKLIRRPREPVPTPMLAAATAPNPPRAGIKRWAFRVGVVLMGLAASGFLVVISGVIPIKASSGHWAITRWFLNFSKERSIATHTLGLKVPALDDPALVLKGAAHFETGCRPCHGSPDLPHPRIAWQMTPPPPYLPTEVAQWANDELFYIVKHGLKFTGMPAWPAIRRDDEVWAMVAFLRKFPELNAEQYQRLVLSGPASQSEASPMEGLLAPDKMPAALSASCARCHGADGLGRTLSAFPKLAGQKPVYLDRSLQAYARGERHSGIMQPIAAALRQDEIAELARYYANLPRPAIPARQAAAALERGEFIALRGIPAQRVPACAACHGPGATRKNPIYPELNGQFADYLVLQLELFKQGARGGTDYAHIMRQVAGQLTPRQMRDVARYYASLGPQAAPSVRNSAVP